MSRRNLASSLQEASSWVAAARLLQEARADPAAFGVADETEVVSAAAAALSVTANAVWAHLGAIEAKDAIAADLDDEAAATIGLSKFAMARTELRKQPNRRSEIRSLLIDQQLSQRALASEFKRLGAADAQNPAAQSRQVGRDFERRLHSLLAERPSLLGFKSGVCIRPGRKSDPIPVDMLATDPDGGPLAALEVKMLWPKLHRQLAAQIVGQLMLLAHVYKEAWLIAPEHSEPALRSVRTLAADLRLSGIQFAAHRTEADFEGLTVVE